MDLYVIRHAPTQWNEEERFQGSCDIPLSDLGRREASQWKAIVEKLPCKIAFCSPQVRAKETLEIVAPHLDCFFLEELRESSFGSWEGKKYEEVRNWLEQRGLPKDFQGLDFSVHGGETLRQVRERVKAGLKKIASHEGPGLVVSHKTTIHALYSLATGWDGASKPSPRMRFPRIHRFSVANDKVEIVALNEALSEETSP